MLAKEGITSTAQPFEGKFGFMKQLNSPFELGKLGGNGTRFKIEDTYFKYLPVLYCAALPIAVGFELRKKLKIEDIESVTLYSDSFILSTETHSAERRDPKTRETADHSVPYLVAAALVDGAITEKTMTPERFRDPTILALAKKIRIAEDKEYTKGYPRTFHCRLEATLNSGKVVIADKVNPKGHPANPMSDQELEDKFLGQVSGLLTDKQSRSVLDSLWNLEKLDDIGKLLAMTAIQTRQ